MAKKSRPAKVVVRKRSGVKAVQRQPSSTRRSALNVAERLSALDRGASEIQGDVKQDIREMAHRNHDRIQLLLPRVESVAAELRRIVDESSSDARDLAVNGALLAAYARELNACALEAAAASAVSSALSEFYQSV